MSRKPKAAASPTFVSFQIAYWSGDSGQTYSVYALSQDGHIYRYRVNDGWQMLEG